MLPHCDPFPVTSVGFSWVPVNFPCWAPILHRTSAGPLANSSGGLTGRRGSPLGFRVECMLSREVCHWPQRGLLFRATAPCWSTSAHQAPTAFLSRLLTGHLCYSGTNLLQAVLVLKVSALPGPLGSQCLAVTRTLYSASQLRHWEMQTCKHFSAYSVVSLALGSCRVYFLLSVGPGMCLSRALSFHVPLGLWSWSSNFHLESP
jgi:hypothetical protein